MHRYDVDLAEAERTHGTEYRSFNDFFTRSLKPDARPLPDDASAIVSPADGWLTDFGHIEDGQLLQTKRHRYPLQELVTDRSLGQRLQGGCFCTIYLAPRDYHRVHAPRTSRLIASVEVPGALFSVNGATEAAMPGLFCKNERLVCEFDDYAMVLVGALIVASIEPTWPGPVSPFRVWRKIRVDRHYQTGDEVARFLVGSTVILIFPPASIELDRDLERGAPMRMGQQIGTRVISSS